MIAIYIFNIPLSIPCVKFCGVGYDMLIFRCRILSYYGDFRVSLKLFRVRWRYNFIVHFRGEKCFLYTL